MEVPHLRARFDLSGVTPGEMQELADRRTSVTALTRRPARAELDWLERSAATHRCETPME